MDENLKIVTVMSVPMCGWNPHWGCHMEAMRPFQIHDTRIWFGAWWDHGIHDLFEDCIEEGVDWILAMDYDSIFSAVHVSTLFRRLGDHPNIDAIAPLQARRGDSLNPIFSGVVDQSLVQNGRLQIDGSPIQVNSANFGLTVLRVDALRRVDRPWMIHQPDANGSYRTNDRVDPDMFFWRKWIDAGNTVFVDPLVRIGHLQPMVSEFDENYEIKHVHWMDWRARNSRVSSEVAA